MFAYADKKQKNLDKTKMASVRQSQNNMDKPAQLQALAYTQGNQLCVGSGQKKHLGHELGRVVQQKQGRVWPTANELSINDNAALKSEADGKSGFEGTIQFKKGKSKGKGQIMSQAMRDYKDMLAGEQDAEEELMYEKRWDDIETEVSKLNNIALAKLASEYQRKLRYPQIIKYYPKIGTLTLESMEEFEYIYSVFQNSDAPPILYEHVIKETSGKQSIIYPGLDSCLGVTVELDDGRKIGCHFVQPFEDIEVEEYIKDLDSLISFVKTQTESKPKLIYSAKDAVTIREHKGNQRVNEKFGILEGLTTRSNVKPDQYRDETPETVAPYFANSIDTIP